MDECGQLTTVEHPMPLRRRRFRISPGHGFVAPAMLFFAAMALLPAIYVVYLSFFAADRRSGAHVFVGLQNYLEVLRNPALAPAATHTLTFSMGSAFFHLLFGFLIALYLNTSLDRRFLNVCRALFLIPWAISPAVVGMVWRLLTHPQISPIGIIATQLHLGQWAPLANPRTALATLTLINIWNFTPFYMLMLLASLQAIDVGLYEAAMIDGANRLQQLRHVTIPEVRRVLFTLGLFDLVTTAVYFDLMWVTTRGGPVGSTDILPTFAYRLAFLSFDFGHAAAIGVFLFLISIGLSAIVVFAMEKE